MNLKENITDKLNGLPGLEVETEISMFANFSHIVHFIIILEVEIEKNNL